jgi:predicted RNase H-like HicB family nuclease
MAKAFQHFNIMLRSEPAGGYTALVPAVPGCVTCGRTPSEARKIANDAITGYIESLKKHGELVPAST